MVLQGAAQYPVQWTDGKPTDEYWKIFENFTNQHIAKAK